jgi:hypothetical protein
MIKIDWLAAGVLLQYYKAAKDWSIIKYAGVILANSSTQWEGRTG